MFVYKYFWLNDLDSPLKSIEDIPSSEFNGVQELAMLFTR